MIKKVFYTVVTYSFFALFTSSIYEIKDKIHTTGISTWTEHPESIKGFKEGLRANGLIEKKNISFIIRNSNADNFIQQQIAQEFKSKKVQPVYSLTTPGTTTIKKNRPKTIPRTSVFLSKPFKKKDSIRTIEKNLS